MNFNYKKFAAGIAAGAILLSSMTPAAFADDKHESHSVYQSSKTVSDTSFGVHSHKLFTFLNGEEEVRGPGDPDAFGIARVNVNHEEGQVCVKLRVYNMEPATAAHIHKADPGQKGPVVVPLPTPDANGRASGCVSVSTDLAEDLVDYPSDFYVNVHNADYPDGALRGQL